MTLPKSEGGLGLLSIAGQYPAIGNLIRWVAMEDVHLLRAILQGHIQRVSLRRWGTADL